MKYQTQKEFLEEVMSSEDSEILDGGLTNQVIQTSVGTVLKEFGEKPKMSYIQALGKVPGGGYDRQDVDDRIQNEKHFREFISDYDIRMPEILGQKDRYLELERIDGTDLDEILRENPSQAEEYGREIGDFLGHVHSKNGAITDLRINNFMMQGDDLVFLDAEYSLRNASEWEKKMDLITLNSSLRQTENLSYHGFRKGFEQSYGQNIGKFNDAASSLLSVGHASVLERDKERLENAGKNIEYMLNRFI